jgi:hypothetical protein
MDERQARRRGSDVITRVWAFRWCCITWTTSKANPPCPPFDKGETLRSANQVCALAKGGDPAFSQSGMPPCQRGRPCVQRVWNTPLSKRETLRSTGLVYPLVKEGGPAFNESGLPPSQRGRPCVQRIWFAPCQRGRPCVQRVWFTPLSKRETPRSTNLVNPLIKGGGPAFNESGLPPCQRGPTRHSRAGGFALNKTYHSTLPLNSSSGHHG